MKYRSTPRQAAARILLPRASRPISWGSGAAGRRHASTNCVAHASPPAYYDQSGFCSGLRSARANCVEKPGGLKSRTCGWALLFDLFCVFEMWDLSPAGNTGSVGNSFPIERELRCELWSKRLRSLAAQLDATARTALRSAGCTARCATNTQNADRYTVARGRASPNSRTGVPLLEEKCR
jgi:hypothetical protein